MNFLLLRTILRIWVAFACFIAAVSGTAQTPLTFYFDTANFYAYEGGTFSGTLHRLESNEGNDYWIAIDTSYPPTYGYNALSASADIVATAYNSTHYYTSVHMNVGQTSATFSISVNNNGTAQSDRAAVLSVFGWSDLAFQNRIQNTNYIQFAWIWLQDNDSPVTPSAYGSQVVEGNNNYFLFDRGANNWYGPMNVLFTLGGSATLAGDYQITALAPATLSLIGSTYQLTIPRQYTQGAVQITTYADSVVEQGNETVSVTVQANSSQYTMPSPSSATMTILDDTPNVLTYVLNPNTTEGGAPIGFVVARSYYYGGGSSKTVNLSIGGTATPGTDYTPSLPATITIPSGESAVTNWITPLTDSAIEGVETATMLVLSGNYYVVANPPDNFATGYIYDDYPVINVDATDNYAAEAGLKAGTFTITRSGNTNRSVTVQLNIAGTATAGADYVALPTNVTFAVGMLKTNLAVTPIANAGTEAAETVVLSLKTNATYFLGLHTNAVVTITGDGTNPRDTYPKGLRYMRGSGADVTAYSIVVPLDGLSGTERDDIDFFDSYTTAYHYNGASAGNQAYITNRIAFNTAIASFGSGWGTPLYLGQSYSLGIYQGDLTGDALLIYTYRRSDGGLAGSTNLILPNIGSSNDWSNFATNGFARSVTGFGLTTVVRGANDMSWGTGRAGWLLTHTASSNATNYLFLILVAGVHNAQYMVLNGSGAPAYGYFYDLAFEARPAWRSLFVDQPHFQGQPLPPDLWNKTPTELFNYGAPVANAVSLAPSACTTNDVSPELRRHPILDQFVADLNNDPLALANYVQNEIDLTDPIAYRDDGSVATESVNEGGVNRSALGVYLESQGSPVEQCALLIYLLRQAGYSATYIFPPEGGLKLLDTRLSDLLRMRINGAQDGQNRLYTTNRLITVNYPWVAVSISNQWVHVFPWLKDTSVEEEGLDIYDYLPDPYKDTQLWVKDYIFGKANILAFATADDDTPGSMFPKFLDNALKQNAPGVSLDDIGMRYVNRRHLYAQWSDFPRPTWVTNVSTAVESLASSGITNVSPRLTNIFDLVTVELYSVNNPQKRIQTAELRMVDLHNRKFYLTHTNYIAPAVVASLNLGPYRPDATGQGTFSASDTGLTNRQVLTLTLDNTDDNLKLRLRHRRQRALSWDTALDPDRGFLDLTGSREVLVERPLRKGDVGAICFNAGRVTPAMLRVHAQELWDMEQKLSTNSAAASTISADIYQGSLVYLMGMSYYERGARFDYANRCFFKVQNLSTFAMGLAKISPRRATDGTLYNGAVDPIWPNVDMFFQEVVSVGNGTVRLDSGWDNKAATRNYYHLSIADLSAQEHAAINIFYGQSNSVSTVKLLQLAQSKVASGGSNVVELNYYNYQAAGNVRYAGKALKDHDPVLWSQVDDMFQRAGLLGYVVGWMAPGPQTNASGSFVGMGAFILGVDRFAALIGNNQYGGYGDSFASQTISPSALSGWDTKLMGDGNYRNSFFAPTPLQPQMASETGEFYKTVSGNTLLNNGSSYLNPTQVQEGNTFGQTLWGANSTLPSVFGPATDVGVLDTRPDDRKGNGFWQSVYDPVNALTGEFYIDDVDLSLPGPMPLQVRRNYGSQNLAANQLGYGWKLNYMPYLSVTPSNIVYEAEADGSVLAFGSIGNNLWAPTLALNPTLNNDSVSGIGSVANRLNARLAKLVVNNTNTWYLTNGDGSLRVFIEMSFPLTNSANWDRLRPYLSTWYDNQNNYYRFEYGINSTQGDYGQVRRIVSSSGNIVRFLYDPYQRVVEAYSADGRRVRYDYDNHGDLVKVTRPDTSEIDYEYQLLTWTTNGASSVYSTHLLLREDKPDGRVLKNEYDGQRRVTNQWATAGPDLRLVRNATFRYTNNFDLTTLTATLTGTTTILDYTNNPTTYFYTNGLIRRVRDPLGVEVVQDWYEATETNAPAYPRSLKTVTNKRGLITSYQYDGRGNATNTVLRGDLRGDGDTNATATTMVVYNVNNLPDKLILPTGTTNLFFYTNGWLLSRLDTWPNNSASNQVVTSLYSYYSVSSGANVSYGLRQQETRAAFSEDAATKAWGYDARGFVVAATNYTGTADSAVTFVQVFNNRGELVQQTDAAGRMTRLGYDPSGNPELREVFEAGQGKPLAWNYSYYNQNHELVWNDGPRFDPEDYVYQDYDGAGRKNVEIRWRSQARLNGGGTEAPTGDALYSTTFFEYDPFNNLTKVTDPLGRYSLKRYDAIGQLIREEFYNESGSLLATNGFAYSKGGDVTNASNALGGKTGKDYNATGKLKSQTNPDGSTNAWRYNEDGRLRREIQDNGAYWETNYDDANRRTTRIFYSAGNSRLATNISELDRRGNVIKTVNVEGHVFTNLFDGLDRIKVAAGPAFVKISLNPLTQVSTTNISQQVTIYTYDASGQVLTTANALGEQTVATSDALGRPTSVQIKDSEGSSVRLSSTVYATNHNGQTLWEGTGPTAIPTSIYTDNDGRNVLTVSYPTNGVWEYERNLYDQAGNRVERAELSNNGGQVALWAVDSWTYDGLNRVATETTKDSATASYGYNSIGNVTNRTLPDGVVWSATYSSAGNILTEQLNGGALASRSFSYQYYAAGNQFAGRLQSVTDGRGVTRTTTYDDFLRPSSVSASGTNNEYNLTATYQYDRRGLPTNILQYFASTNTGPQSRVRRDYDGYGHLLHEWFSIGSEPEKRAVQDWDEAGRRTVLDFPLLLTVADGIGFAYRADGSMASVGYGWYFTDYSYGDNGRLLSRVNDARTVSIDQRDGRGRVLKETTSITGTPVLTETSVWRNDGRLTSYSAVRNGYTDSRGYGYSSLARRLTSETLAVASGQQITNSYAVDFGQSAKLGVVTSAAQSGAFASTWSVPSGGLDGLRRLTNSQNTLIKRPATGKALGAASLSGTLNGRPVPIQYDSGSSNGRWRASLELSSGQNTLIVSATHPSYLYSTSATNTFSNGGASADSGQSSYDGNGNLTVRVLRNGSNNIVTTQTLTWDANDRLVKVTERDPQNTGSDWTAINDPLGRRLRTTHTLVISNAPQPSPTVLDSIYDPQVEFLEVGVAVNGEWHWKIYGPDASGRYGGMQGVGGLEAVLSQGLYDYSYRGTISDQFGNVLAQVDFFSHGQLWFSTRVAAYGPVAGYPALLLSRDEQAAVRVPQSLSWRGLRIDPTGFYCIGARYYDPVARRFLSTDPLGFASGWDIQGLCNGDPLNHFDPDGRYGKKAVGVAGDVITTIVATIFTPQPDVPPELLTDRERQIYGGLSRNVQNSIGHPLQDSGFYQPDSGLALTRDVLAAGAEVYALGRSGRQMVNVNVPVPEPNYSTPPTGFYVTPDGVAVPSTGYRAIGGPNVAEAQNGVIEPRDYPGTYATFNNLIPLDRPQIMSGLQLPPARPPTHLAVFDTLQTIESLEIPRGLHGEGLFHEPITSWYPAWGAGGFSQATTFEPIQGAAVIPIMSGAKVNQPPVTISLPLERIR